MYRYKQIAEKIITDINKGELTPGMPVPSTRELCAKYTVSHLTAIHALNYLAKKGILIHHPRRNFCVAHRFERQGQSFAFLTLLFRYVSIEGTEFYGNRIIGGITREAASASVCSLFASTTAQSIYLKNNNFTATFQEALLIPHQNIGFIADYFIPDEIISEIIDETKLPVVLIGRESTLHNVHSVIIDAIPAYRTMLHTVKRLGYQKFLCCESTSEVRAEHLQQKTFFNELLEKEDGHIIHGFDTISSAERISTLEMLCKKYKKQKILILAASDEDARWILEWLQQNKISVPNQVGVLGFYGTRIATDFSQKISCLSIKPEFLGKLAAQLLISKDLKYQIHKLPMDFVFGETI